MTSVEGALGEARQRRLADWNRLRLAPAFPGGEIDYHDVEMLDLEGVMLAELRAEIADAAGAAPSDVNGFIRWFEDLRESGPGQHDGLFPWLADHASLDDIRWFFEQEAAGEAGFEDLVALTQVKMPERAKLELARNYWDEMGRGNPKGMHGPMLTLLAKALKVEPAITRTVSESLTLANAMIAMATRRDYAWHSLGALGVIELTAPDRAMLISKGLRRVGISGKERHYFDLHAVLDVKHSEEWNREVLTPLVSEQPERARYIAEGALMRLSCGQRCFARYREHLWSIEDARRPIDQAA